jgi:hypothetical protein
MVRLSVLLELVLVLEAELVQSVVVVVFVVFVFVVVFVLVLVLALAVAFSVASAVVFVLAGELVFFDVSTAFDSSARAAITEDINIMVGTRYATATIFVSL